ncbi:colanic acid transporter [Colwellia sp. MT41]|uniref:MOP flippase family protein n=1 Tax=Colwellia sp. MT41 TaxID=58049 RepID=UPI0007178EA2|nr:MOP flippase family protein [Colwellia sp. MT41]ALO35123.1 colanic acid transporter [Colwellia sp. MT41]
MSLKVKALAGVKWTGLSSIIVAVLQLAQMAILVRYLDASDFGLMAIVSVVIGFSALFMDMGISSAIIHKQDITKNQLSSLYWLNIIAGIVLAVIVYILAPAIALFYDENSLTNLIRLLALTFVFSSIGNQYRILYQKELFFNKLAKVEILSSIIAFVVAVICAVEGYGVYSLVYASLTKVVIANTIFLVKGIKKHKPEFYFSYNEIKSMIGFGLFQMGERSLNYFNSQFDIIIIGKVLGTEVLGVYSIVKMLAYKPFQMLNPIINKVSFPVFAKIQDNEKGLKSAFLSSLSIITFAVFPIYFLLSLFSPFLLDLYLGQDWADAAKYFQLISASCLFIVFGNPTGSLQLAKGRADMGFYWNLFLFFIFPPFIYLTASDGIMTFLIGTLILRIGLLYPGWKFLVARLIDIKFNEYISHLFIPLVLNIIALLPSLLFYELILGLNFPDIFALCIVTIIYTLLIFSLYFFTNKSFRAFVLKYYKSH